MTVEGNEQRVYGRVSGDCFIDLHRFAWVIGSSTESPSTYVGTTHYGDFPTYATAKPCSVNKAGNLTVNFTDTKYGNPKVAVEVMRCDSEEVIDVWSYGIQSITSVNALWYNENARDAEFPSWSKLNSANASVIMGESSTSFVFEGEVLSEDITYNITCCEEDDTCSGCKCLVCNITSRFYVKATIAGTIFSSPLVLSYGYLSYGDYTLCYDVGQPSRCDETYEVYYIDDDSTHNLLEIYAWEDLSSTDRDIYVEYRMNCETIDIWTYPNPDPNNYTLSVKIISSCCNNVTLNDAACASKFVVGQSVGVIRKVPDNLFFTYGNVERVDGATVYINNIHHPTNTILDYDRSVWTPDSLNGCGFATSNVHNSGQTYLWQVDALTAAGCSWNVYCSFSYTLDLPGVMYDWYWGGTIYSILSINTSGTTTSIASGTLSGVQRHISGTYSGKFHPTSTPGERYTYKLGAWAGCDAMTLTISNLRFWGCPDENFGCSDEFRCLPLDNSYYSSWNFYLQEV